MASLDRTARALGHARAAYERARIATAVRGVVLAGVLVALALGLHRMSPAAWLAAAALAALLATLGWRGGTRRRGALAGVVAGVPPLIAPSVLFALSHGGSLVVCEECPALPCLVTCFATSLVAGVLVGYRAVTESSPRQFAVAAVASAALTGLLSCGTTGLGGALGIVVGLVVGGVAGWIVATRAAHA